MRKAILAKEDERMHERKQITDRCKATIEEKRQLVESETSLRQINKKMRKISRWVLRVDFLKQVAFALGCHVKLLPNWRKEEHEQQQQRWKQCLEQLRQEECRRQQEECRQQKQLRQEERCRQQEEAIKLGDEKRRQLEQLRQEECRQQQEEYRRRNAETIRLADERCPQLEQFCQEERCKKLQPLFEEAKAVYQDYSTHVRDLKKLQYNLGN